jgi:methionyl-tRNA formyltransferase
MTKGVDDGPILAQEPYGIGADETARHITDKVSAIFERLIPEVVERYAKDDPPEEAPQDGKNACRWTRRKPEDGLIRWGDLTVRQAVDLVRALDDPYPGAFIMCKGEPLIIRRARPYIRKVMGIPGRFVGRTEDGCLILAKDGAVEILEFARKGKAFPGVRFPASYGETF